MSRQEHRMPASLYVRGDYSLEDLGVNADVIGGIRYVIIEAASVKIALPYDSARELSLRLAEAANAPTPPLTAEEKK